ncbi:oligosaccharide flippase family protein [Lachnospiraceae bacterium 48-21]
MRIQKKQGDRVSAALLSYLLTILHIIVNLIYSPLLIHYIGDSEYGLYQLAASFFSYIAIFESSVSVGVLRFYCNAKAKKDEDAVENVLAVARYIYNILSLIVLAAGSMLVVVFYYFYRSSFSHTELVEGCFMLAALLVNLLIILRNAIYLAAISGNERFVFLRVTAICIQIGQPVLCYLVIVRHPYALAVVLTQLLFNMVQVLVRFIYAKRRLRVKAVRHGNGKKLSGSILAFAGSMLLGDIANQIFWKTDQVIIGKMYNTAMVAIYSVGSQIYSNYMQVGTSVNSIFYPKLSRLYQEPDYMVKLSDFFIKAGRVVYYVLFLMLSGFAVFGREFIGYWVGENYAAAYEVALIIMIPFSIDLVQNVGLTILQVLNRYHFRAKIYFVGAVLNIFTTIIFMKWIGMNGAALSTGISMLLTSGVILNIYYDRMGLDIPKFWKNIGGITVRLLIYAAIMWFIDRKIGLWSGMVGLAARIFVYSMGYAVVCYFFIFNEYEKGIVSDLFRRR